MPLRDYICEVCEHIWEELRKDQTDPQKCKLCDSTKIKRKLSSSNFRLRGTGWYKPSKD